MFGRSKLLWVVAFASILSLVGGASAMAQSMPGYGSSASMGTETGWITLNPGQQHWYTFFSTSADSKATDAQITATLATNPQDGATFNVWTPEELQSLAAGNTDITSKPVGSGTLHQVKDGDNHYDRFGGMLQWAAQSLHPQTYLVQVESNASIPVQYNLMVDGDYIRFTNGTLAGQALKQNLQMASASMNAAATQQVAMATSSNANNLPAPVILPSTGKAASPSLGSSPSMALSLNGEMRSLNPGQSQWYVLQYPGELKGGDIPEGTLELIGSPQGSANFSVWTAERLALRDGDEFFNVPVGNGTLHPFTDGGIQFDRYDGNPAWTNKSKFADTFYIQVQNTGSSPSTYMLKYIQQ